MGVRVRVPLSVPKDYMTDKEKIRLYEKFLHDIHFAYSVCMDENKVHELLKKASDWSYAHRSGNGEYTEEQQEEQVLFYLKKFEE